MNSVANSKSRRRQIQGDNDEFLGPVTISNISSEAISNKGLSKMPADHTPCGASSKSKLYMRCLAIAVVVMVSVQMIGFIYSKPYTSDLHHVASIAVQLGKDTESSSQENIEQLKGRERLLWLGRVMEKLRSGNESSLPKEVREIFGHFESVPELVEESKHFPHVDPVKIFSLFDKKKTLEYFQSVVIPTNETESLTSDAGKSKSGSKYGNQSGFEAREM